MEYRYGLLDIGLKKTTLIFLFLVLLSSVSFATECPVQEFKQYAEKLDKAKIESIDRLKDNYKQIASGQSSVCKSLLFKDLRHYHGQMIEQQAVSIEVTLNEIGYDNMEREIKKHKAELYTIGVSVQQNEGYYFIVPNSAWYLEEFVSLLSDEWKRFLKQCAHEEENRLTDDAALMISWEDLRKRVLFWEKFLDDHSDFVEKNTAKEYLSLYASIYVRGSGNSPIYIWDTRKIFPEIKKSYENFIKLNSESKYYDMVKSQYMIIKDHTFIIDKKTAKKLDVNYDCAKRDLSMDESDSKYFDASFKCCMASTSIEKYICSDKELADMDKELGILYGYIKTYLPKKQKEVLLKKQRAWAKNRKKTCRIPKEFIKNDEVVQCLKDEYLNRMEELWTIVDGDSLELGPWYYAKRDSKDPFAGYYSQFYEVHSATTLEDSSIVENFLSIIKIKDPEIKNKYYVAGNFTCANFHNCTINNAYSNDDSMMEYIIMEPKDGKLFFTQKIDENRTCEFLIEKKRDALVLHSADPDCTQYCFSCGVRCWLDGWEFKLKNTDNVVQKNFENTLYPLYKNGKYGYIDSKGNWVIKAQFDEAYGFKENELANVKLNGKEGTINRKGEFSPQLSEDDAGKSAVGLEQEISAKNSFSRVKIGDKFGIKNSKDKWLFKPQFEKIVEDDYSGFLVYDGGLFLVVYQGKKGIVNTKGKWVIKEYDDILYGQENIIVDINGWIKVKLNGKWGAVNTDGKWIFKPQFDDVSSFTVKGQLTVKYKDKWGFMDTEGKWVLEPKYDDVYDFAENDVTGFGRIICNGKEGYVSDVDGLLLEPTLDRHKYSPELENIFVLQKTGLLKVGYDRWGVVDKKGKWLLKQRFDDVEILDDKIHVKFADKEGYTSLDGKYLTFTKNELAQGFHSAIDRHYPFVCYSKKSKNPEGKVIYQGCVRSDKKCSGTHKMHFGEYPNDLKAHEAFGRCSKGDPKFVDPQRK